MVPRPDLFFKNGTLSGPTSLYDTVSLCQLLKPLFLSFFLWWQDTHTLALLEHWLSSMFTSSWSRPIWWFCLYLWSEPRHVCLLMSKHAHVAHFCFSQGSIHFPYQFGGWMGCWAPSWQFIGASFHWIGTILIALGSPLAMTCTPTNMKTCICCSFWFP